MKLQNILILIILLLGVGGFYYFSNVPAPIEKPDAQTFVWLIEMEEIEHVKIELPRESLSESFLKISEEDKFPWYFDDEANSPVDAARWGGGIPLLLSGPGADRIIAKNASPEKMAEFGLDNPLMIISLTLESGRVMTIDVGDSSPSGATYYVRAPNTNDIALVDYSWFDVLANLVKNPPYAPPAEEE